MKGNISITRLAGQITAFAATFGIKCNAPATCSLILKLEADKECTTKVIWTAQLLPLPA